MTTLSILRYLFGPKEIEKSDESLPGSAVTMRTSDESPLANARDSEFHLSLLRVRLGTSQFLMLAAFFSLWEEI